VREKLERLERLERLVGAARAVQEDFGDTRLGFRLAELLQELGEVEVMGAAVAAQ